MFQSTPVITDGRTGVTALREHIAQLFQSTPVITDGRTGGRRGFDAGHGCFNPRPSSLTGERWRWGRATVTCSCFNPRPSSLTGERNKPLSTATQNALFQSTPVITDGRTVVNVVGPNGIGVVSIHARHH